MLFLTHQVLQGLGEVWMLTSLTSGAMAMRHIWWIVHRVWVHAVGTAQLECIAMEMWSQVCDSTYHYLLISVHIVNTVHVIFTPWHWIYRMCMCYNVNNERVITTSGVCGAVMGHPTPTNNKWDETYWRVTLCTAYIPRKGWVITVCWRNFLWLVC